MDYLDMIAKLGVGNAHPGGFASTVRLLEQFPVKAGMDVLEIGCGTGRTACHLAKEGCLVTAVDIHPVMLAKAHRRAEAEQVKVTIVEASAEKLPFAAESFDLVLVESVSIFTDAARSVSEYVRVLKPGGLLLDRELMAASGLPEAVAAELAQYYRVNRLRSAEEWLILLKEAGFSEAELWDRSKISPQLWEDVMYYPDLHQQADQDVYQSQDVWTIASKYDQLMSANQALFEHAVLVGRKG